MINYAGTMLLLMHKGELILMFRGPNKDRKSVVGKARDNISP